ncbi:MAG: DUF308 domain-containing protein [Firmicutes bacterium]|nr:DUF308 domain-containing protein [Bacillota bacterium]
MRISTVIAGVIYVAMGALCFIFQGYNFAGLAFPAGILMTLAGIFITIAFVASGKKFRLPDTVLVEGLIDMMFGFAVLNNQVSDSMLSLFFGAFTCIAGATRLSQSLDVSRYRPKDWARVMPLSIITAILGVIMMMPQVIPKAAPMTMIGGAFIINGFSLLVYSMYMEKRTASQRAEEARQRVMMKKEAANEKRRQRDMLRSLSKQEREEALAKIKQEKKEAKQQKREARRLELELSRAARRPAPDDTIPISKDEEEEIKRIADKLGLEDQAVIQDAINKAASAAETAAEANVQSEEDIPSLPDESESETRAAAGEPETQAPLQEPAAEAEAALDAGEEEAPALPQAPAEELLRRPGRQKTLDIPSLRSTVGPTAALEEKEDPALPKLAAVNLEAFESEQITVEFESPQLRPVELVSETVDAVDRRQIIKDLEKPVEQKDDFTDYVPLRLEDLIDEELPKINTSVDDRFTQRMSFTWGVQPYDQEAIRKEEERQRLKKQKEQQEQQRKEQEAFQASAADPDLIFSDSEELFPKESPEE